MPTMSWLRKEFDYGYDSGDVLSLIPSRVRRSEEKKVGGSYRQVFKKGLQPHLHPSARVLELGPGKGSWSRAILDHIPEGELHTVDFLDVTPWLRPENFGGRLTCHRVQDNNYDGLPGGYFDVFWSFGVLCHNEASMILEILTRIRNKMKPGAVAVHQYGDWEKLEAFGWNRGGVPQAFKSKVDQEIWWPRNNQKVMTRLGTEAGWEVLNADLGLLQRDSVILLRNPRP
jgi:SAM-dependent methyltransferase